MCDYFFPGNLYAIDYYSCGTSISYIFLRSIKVSNFSLLEVPYITRDLLLLEIDFPFVLLFTYFLYFPPSILTTGFHLIVFFYRKKL